MRQPAIPKLSELSTAGRAELLATWTATLGKPPAALRTSRELLASALAWQLQERKFGGLNAATKRGRKRTGPAVRTASLLVDAVWCELRSNGLIGLIQFWVDQLRL